MFSGNKIHFVSLGCARNLVDSEVMLGIFLKAGYEATARARRCRFSGCQHLRLSWPSPAKSRATRSISLVKEEKKTPKSSSPDAWSKNTAASRKTQFPASPLFSWLGRCGKNPRCRPVARGRARRSPRPAAISNGEKSRAHSRRQKLRLFENRRRLHETMRLLHHPYDQRTSKSKTEEQVVKEFNALSAQGVYEVILIAQDLGDFGKDRKEKDGLAQLLRQDARRSKRLLAPLPLSLSR